MNMIRWLANYYKMIQHQLICCPITDEYLQFPFILLQRGRYSIIMYVYKLFCKLMHLNLWEFHYSFLLEFSGNPS